MPLVAPLVLLLLSQVPAPAEPPPRDECAAASPRLELPAEPTAKAPVVCITPGLSLSFSFDSLLRPGSVRLGEPDWFVDTATGKQTLTLKPRKSLEAGKRSEVAVCFADGAAPACATFVLVVHPGLGMQEVEVSRQKRTVEAYQQAEREAQAETARCRAEVRQLRAEREAPEGLRGALASGLLVQATSPLATRAHRARERVAWPCGGGGAGLGGGGPGHVYAHALGRGPEAHRHPRSRYLPVDAASAWLALE